MADYQTIRTAGAGVRSAEIDAGLRAHMNKVYGLMSVAMVITGGVAWGISGLATTTDPSQAVVTIQNGVMLTSLGSAIYLSALKWVVMLAPLAMVFAFGAAVNRLSAGAAQLFFYAFAALFGLSLSSIFLMYTGASIVQTFLVTAIAFAGLSLYGYVTKRDLSAMGTFMVMGLWGLLVAMLLNWFFKSPALDFVISVAGVVIFAGLTAWDTQKIKTTYIQHAQSADSDWLGKSAIMGALTLYLDFINLFMFLLRFMGNNRN